MSGISGYLGYLGFIQFSGLAKMWGILEISGNTENAGHPIVDDFQN